MDALRKITMVLVGIDLSIIVIPFIFALLFPTSSFMEIGFIFPVLGFIMAPFIGGLFLITFLFDNIHKAKNNKKFIHTLPDKEFCIDTEDTDFFFLVNTDLYRSFVDEDWELEQDLLPHLQKQQELGNILMYKLNNDVTLNKWIVHTYLNKEIENKPYFKMARNYIEVTNNTLNIIDYSCLTKAALFSDEHIPNEIYRLELEDGLYEVKTYLYNDIENGNKLTRQEDMAIYITLISDSLVSKNIEIDWS